MPEAPAAGAGRAPVDAGAPAVLYESPDCWKCVEVRERLDALGVPYETVTVRGDPEARAALVRAQGEPPQVPMLVDRGVAVWDRRRIVAYLDETHGGGREGPSYRDLPVYMGGVCQVDAPGSC